MPKLAWIILASPISFFERLGKKEAGLAVIIGLLSIGYTANEVIDRTVGSVATVLEEHEDNIERSAARIDTLSSRADSVDSWIETHERTVSAPGLRDIARNQQMTDSILRDFGIMREMIYQLYCDRWPERCQSIPSGDESS